MQEPLTPAQRTLSARQALAAKFSSPEEKSRHYRSLARRSNERRLVLSADEAAALAAALGDASALLTRLLERTRPSSEEVAA